MKPEDVGYTTELDREYAKALQEVNNPIHFGEFLKNWGYWLDAETCRLCGNDWNSIKPLLDDCRDESAKPNPDIHQPAIALLMPEKIFRISIEKLRYKAPWGCVYIRFKEMKKIDY